MKARFLSVLLVATLANLAACGGDDAQTNGKTVTRLDGTYKPADSGGAIASITFTGDVSYLLMPSGCSGGDCAQIGTYRIEEETSTLWLEDASTHRTRSIPLEVLATTPPANASLVKQSLRIMGDLVDPGTQLTQGNGQLNNGSGNQLNESNGQKLADKIVDLIQTITQMIMDGQKMNQQKQDDADEPKKPNPLDCAQGVPTANSTAAEKLAYFARCPGGP